jgi:T5orf172 domain
LPSRGEVLIFGRWLQKTWARSEYHVFSGLQAKPAKTSTLLRTPPASKTPPQDAILPQLFSQDLAKELAAVYARLAVLEGMDYPLEAEQAKMRERNVRKRNATARQRTKRSPKAKPPLKPPTAKELEAERRKRELEAEIQEYEFQTKLEKIGMRKPKAVKFVYLLSNAEHGLCKIGHAENVDKRRKDLERDAPFPFPLEVLNSWQTPEYFALEKALHAHFDDRRVKSEWFRFTDADIARCQEFVATWFETP